MTKRTSVTVAGTAFVTALLFGCAHPAKFTGGGWLPSTSGGVKDKANLGFNVKNCAPGEEDISGHFNFHDNKAPAYAVLGGVKFGGFVVGGGLCTSDDTEEENEVVACDPSGTLVPSDFCPQDDGWIGIDVAYESTNPKLPGDGTAVACARDNGQGVNATSDQISILVLDGPYAGYANSGTVKGNLKQHVCTCTDGIDNDGDSLIDADDPGCNLINGLNGDESGA
jgi:hypothetical protein